MLLRRITQHVKDQNWFAVFLDFAIVVIGVFIGMQVANWNSERADRGLRGQYLTQLKADLQADIKEAKETEKIAWGRVGAVIDIFEAAGLETPLTEIFLDGKVNVAPAIPDFNSDYEYAHNHVLSYLLAFEETGDTFQAIVSNGHFQLLNDSQLVRAIQQYYGLVEATRRTEQGYIEHYRRRLTESRSRHGISSGGRTTLASLAAAIASDKKFAADLETHCFNSGFQAGRMLEIQAAAATLISTIEAAE